MKTCPVCGSEGYVTRYNTAACVCVLTCVMGNKNQRISKEAWDALSPDVQWAGAGMSRMHMESGAVFLLKESVTPRIGAASVSLTHRLTGSQWLEVVHMEGRWLWRFVFGYSSDEWKEAASEGAAMRAGLVAAGVIKEAT